MGREEPENAISVVQLAQVGRARDDVVVRGALDRRLDDSAGAERPMSPA
jgi:hypothetical protein